MINVLKWLGERLSEKSSWVGIASLFTAVGLQISPELWEQIVSAGAAIAAAGLVIIKEKTGE